MIGVFIVPSADAGTAPGLNYSDLVDFDRNDINAVACENFDDAGSHRAEPNDAYSAEVACHSWSLADRPATDQKPESRLIAMVVTLGSDELDDDVAQ